MKKGFLALLMVVMVSAGMVFAQANMEMPADGTAAVVATNDSATAWGAAAAQAAQNPSVEDMLRYAIEDEYLAHAEYEAILAQFGTQRPFSNIVQSEVQHISMLTDVYDAHGIAVPEDKGAEHVVMPADIKEALETGVQAEIDNIAMYEKFLDSELLSGSEYADVKDLFIQLRDASKNHLSAFQNALKRYQ
ncbi:MAG: hypothetical protein LKE40_04800 [Spirochaetia bacterium]|jgi:hypothetical protein|nr:hypothetical protein [Spirochaetia bacterium]